MPAEDKNITITQTLSPWEDLISMLQPILGQYAGQLGGPMYPGALAAGPSPMQDFATRMMMQQAMGGQPSAWGFTQSMLQPQGRLGGGQYPPQGYNPFAGAGGVQAHGWPPGYQPGVGGRNMGGPPMGLPGGGPGMGGGGGGGGAPAKGPTGGGGGGGGQRYRGGGGPSMALQGTGAQGGGAQRPGQTIAPGGGQGGGFGLPPGFDPLQWPGPVGEARPGMNPWWGRFGGMPSPDSPAWHSLQGVAPFFTPAVNPFMPFGGHDPTSKGSQMYPFLRQLGMAQHKDTRQGPHTDDYQKPGGGGGNGRGTGGGVHPDSPEPEKF